MESLYARRKGRQEGEVYSIFMLHYSSCVDDLHCEA
jgi:hypothetical protein